MQLDALSILVISLDVQEPPLFYVLKSSVKTYWCRRHAYIVLGYIAYIFKRGVDAFNTNLFKKALSTPACILTST